MNEQSADEQLVLRAQEGDLRAFDVLVQKYQHKIVQLVGRIVGDADAQDVAQESFIKAYRALGKFRGQSQFYTWLYRIAINTAKNFLVARRRRPATQDIDVARGAFGAPTFFLGDEMFFGNDRLDFVEEALRG